jgi:hypothetical protein
LHFLSMQGLSVLERMEKLLRPNGDITLLP